MGSMDTTNSKTKRAAARFPHQFPDRGSNVEQPRLTVQDALRLAGGVR